MNVSPRTTAVPEPTPEPAAQRCTPQDRRTGSPNATCTVEPAPAWRAPDASSAPPPAPRPEQSGALEAEALACRARLGVELCTRTADIPVARELNLQHHWLRTSTREAGMGPDNGEVPGARLDSPLVTRTQVNDHTGRGDLPGSACTAKLQVDEACVDRELTLGRDLGRWTPTNQCQSFVAEVLEKCSNRKATP